MFEAKTNRYEYYYALGAAFLLSIFLTLVSPLGMIVSNVKEIAVPPYSILLASTPYFLITFAVLFSPILFPWRTFKKLYLNLLFVILAFSLITSLFLFGHYGEFDGRSLEINRFSQESLLQVFTLLLLTVAIFFIRKKYFLYLSSVLVFTECIFSSYELYHLSDSNSESMEYLEKNEFVNLSQNQPNYLYIILDEVYGQSTQDIFDNNKSLAKNFSGFTNYTNTAGIYPTTIVSVPAILTGELYNHTKDDINFLLKAFDHSPLLHKLGDNEFDSKLITLPYYQCSPQKFKNPPSFLPRFLGNKMTSSCEEYLGFLNFSIFKATPDLLKPYLYVNGRWSLNLSILREGPTASWWIREFDFFAQHLHASNSSPTFRMFHTTITHSPVKYDKSCTYLHTSPKPTYENFLSQDTCGFIQVARILNRLKELNIYDNTYIIISSDHGRRYGVQPHLAQQFTSADIPPKHHGLSHATLMVKPFNSNMDFKNDSTPMSLLDIAPLIISSIDGKAPAFHPERRKFHYYPWSMGDFTNSGGGQGKLPPIVDIYSIGEDIQNPSDWVTAPINLYRLIPIAEGDIVNFGRDGKNTLDVYKARSRYVSEGLGSYNDWGRWSDNNKVVIRFKLSKMAQVKDVTLEIIAEVTKYHPQQKIEIRLNGTTIGEESFGFDTNLPNQIKVAVPQGLIKLGQYNELELVHTSNMNSKHHKYRIGIKSMKFD